jgi:hypothetical protein
MSGSNRRRIAGEPGTRSGSSRPPVVPARRNAPSRPAPTPEEEPARESVPTEARVPAGAKVPSAARPAKPAAEPADGGADASPRFPWLLGLAALVALVGGTTLLVLGLQSHQRTGVGEGPADAARVAISTIDTFDYLDMKGHDERSKRLMTDAFASKAKNWQPLTAQQAEENQAQGAATVSAAATMWCSRDCSEDRAKVLVFYDQQLDAKGFKRPKLASQRAIVTMSREGGRWLVDGIERIKSADLQ